MGLLLTLLYQAFGKSNGELNMRYLAMIQARYGSSRMPGKILMSLCGKPVLHFLFFFSDIFVFLFLILQWLIALL